MPLRALPSTFVVTAFDARNLGLPASAMLASIRSPYNLGIRRGRHLGPTKTLPEYTCEAHMQDGRYMAFGGRRHAGRFGSSLT